MKTMKEVQDALVDLERSLLRAKHHRDQERLTHKVETLCWVLGQTKGDID